MVPVVQIVLVVGWEIGRRQLSSGSRECFVYGLNRLSLCNNQIAYQIAYHLGHYDIHQQDSLLDYVIE